MPKEIWYKIFNIVLEREPSSRFRLRNVNTLFRDILDNTPCLIVYISPSILNVKYRTIAGESSALY